MEAAASLQSMDLTETPRVPEWSRERAGVGREGRRRGADLLVGEGEVGDEVPWGAVELTGLRTGSRGAREAGPAAGFGRGARRRVRRRRRQQVEPRRRINGRGGGGGGGGGVRRA